MIKDTNHNNNIRGGAVVSLASKMIRCLLILPLMALLLPGKDSSGDHWGCLAFQHHRYPAKKPYSTGFDQRAAPRIRMLNDAIGGATPNANYFWTAKKARFRSKLAATESDDDEAEQIAKRKVEAEAKKASAEAEAKRLKAEAEKAAKLKAEQDEKLKEAQEMLALLQKEAEARKKAEEETAKQQAEAEEKQKQAEEEAAKIKAEEEEKKKAEEEAAAKQKAQEEEKERLKAKKKADELATLLKAKEEAARVMAEIDAKLQAQTAEADEEEAERVEKLQADAEQMPDLDDESDEMLKKMMEEMEKVRIELDSRLEAEAKEAAAKAKAEEEARIKEAEEKAAAKAIAEELKAEEEAAAKAKSEEKSKADSEEEKSGETADLMDRIKSGAKFDPVAKTVAAEQVEEIPPYFSKPQDEPIDTTATAPPKPKPMPDLSSSSKGKTEAKKKATKEDSKPKWMVDWKKDGNTKDEDEVKAKSTAKEDEKAVEDTEEEEEDEPGNKSSDPRTKGRSRKENLFDVIGRTATGGVTMDEITKRKKKPQTNAPTPPTELVSETKKKGPPDSFGQSVAASYRTGNQEKKDSGRVMPDLQNMKELKKRGPPASFGKYAAAASTAGSSPIADPNDTIDARDKGPPASFGASVAMASSGEVPKDLLSRGTASTDASTPPQTKPTSSRKRGPDSNIIDVVDVEYTKKDADTKAEKPPSRPVGSAPPLEVEKTVPQAPPLQVEKTVPPMKNPPKKEEKSETVAEKKAPAAPNPIKNIGKAAVEKVFGQQKKKDSEDDAKPKTTEEDVEEKKGGVEKEKAMEDRVAELLKEAFSLSKEDSRVADLLQGVVAITTGKEDKKKKEGKRSVKKASSKGRKRASQVAAEEEFEDEEEEIIDDDDEYDDDEDDYDDDDEDNFDDDEEEEEEEPVIMGGRNRRMEDRNAPGRNANRRGPPNRGMGNNRYMEDTRRPGPFGDIGNDGFFEDNDDDYFEYDGNDRWRGRGPGPRRGQEPPMNSGGYSVRPPPQSRGDSRSEEDDDYYFLQFGSPGSPSSRYDEPRGSNYYDEDYYYDDDDYDGPQPGAPRPAYSEPQDEAPKGPPASFGNFVADASMAKTGYAPTSMKDDKVGTVNGGSGSGGGGGAPGEEWGEEMSQSTGSMLTPRGVKVNGSGGKASSSQPHFVVSEDQSGSGGRKKGPPSTFGNSVAAAGEQQTGNPMRSIEEEIANGGMATPTGGMATPKRKTPANPPPPSGGAGQGKKKPLFIVSEEEAGPADFGSSVAEASGARTGWAPKTPKRPSGGLEGGTTGGMRPKIKKKANPQSSTPQKKEFGDSVFDDCPPLDSEKKKKSQADLPLTRKQSVDTDLNQKTQRNPAVNLVDGGASKNPPRPVQYSGSMMAPRIRRKAPPAQQPPPEIEGDSLEDEEKK